MRASVSAPEEDGAGSGVPPRAMTIVRVLAVLAAVGFVGWLLLRPRPEQPLHEGPTSEPPAQAPESATDGESTGVELAGRADAQPAADGSPSPAAPPPLEPVRLTVRGSVVSALDGAGVSGVVVHVSSPRGPEHRADSTPSDVRGAVELELRGEDWRLGCVRHALAIESSSGRRRFEGLVRLDQDFVIELDEMTRLHGVVIAPPWAHAEPISIAAFTAPVRGVEVYRWIASTKAALSGEFEMHARVPPHAEFARLEIAVGELSSVRYDVALAELASDLGVEIQLELNALRVRVFDSTGAALPGASVSIANVAEGPLATPAQTLTDATGLALFTRSPGEFEVCVGAVGHRSHVERVALEGADLDFDVRLETVAAEAELFGVVLLDTGEPAPDALVAVGPVTLTRDLSVRAISTVRTDEHGEFRLSVASTAPLQLTAYHRDWGITDPLPVVVDGRRLVVWLPRTGKLQVDVLTDAVPGPFRAGLVEYVLRHRRSGALESGDASALPLVLEELVAGEYDVFVLLEGLDAVAEGFARVDPVQPSTTVLAARAANWIDGRVSYSDGEPIGGVRVTAHGRWPAEVAARLCTATTNLDGRFRVLCADRSAELVVHDAQAEWARKAALAGEFSAIALP